jgi:hypothetical protein
LCEPDKQVGAMTWVKGQSGNPKGRPPKGRALSEILERAGSAGVQVGDKRISGKRLVAQLVWELAATGRALLPQPDGSAVMLEVTSADEWLAVVKLIYGQVDGPPPKDINLGGQTENPLVVEVVWDDAGIEGETAEPALGTAAGEVE